MKAKRLLRGLFAAAVIWCAAVEIANGVARSQFGMELDGDWFLLLSGSSTTALSDFFSVYAQPLGLAFVGFLIFASAVIWLAIKSPRRLLFVWAALAAVYVIFHCPTIAQAKAWKPLYLLYDTIRGARLYASIAAAGEWTAERAAQVSSPSIGATNYVFVIGESMTTHRLPFFGYEKNTMPKLHALGDRLEVRGPVRAPSPYTVLALPALFVSDGSSTAVKYRQRGYQTAFVGAHHRWARYCSVEASVFAACERKIYLSELPDAGHVYDDMLLPHVQKVINEFSQTPERPFILFIHMMGSHFPPSARVRADYLADSGLDDYDRSLRFSDEVLASIIKTLPPRTVLIYTSDHGESVDTDNWRNFNSRALWSVPIFIYPAGSPVPDGITLPEPY